MLPGDVQIQRISLGWTQPVALYGLTVFEGEAGSSRQLIGLQRFSSAGGWEVVTDDRGGVLCKFFATVVATAPARYAFL
jgi:hypothetical protein